MKNPHYMGIAVENDIKKRKRKQISESDGFWMLDYLAII